MELLTVGRMAHLNGVSVQTLRLYDKMGLLLPSEVGENGYRYYNMAQCARLDMIQYMKSLGMDLRTIKQQLDKKDWALLGEFLAQKSDDINRQIKALNQQKRAVERAVERYELYANAPPDGAILLEFIGKRLMYKLDTGINFYDYDISVYEEMLCSLKRSLLDNHLPRNYFNNAGTILRKEHLQSRTFASTEVFVFVDADSVSADLITPLPRSMYLCIYCDSFDKEREYCLRLLDAVEEHGYTVTGDCICEVIVDSPVFEDSRQSMFFRLQVPIRF